MLLPDGEGWYGLWTLLNPRGGERILDTWHEPRTRPEQKARRIVHATEAIPSSDFGCFGKPPLPTVRPLSDPVRPSCASSSQASAQSSTSYKLKALDLAARPPLPHPLAQESQKQAQKPSLQSRPARPRWPAGLPVCRSFSVLTMYAVYGIRCTSLTAASCSPGQSGQLA